MSTTAGIDIGSEAIKAIVLDHAKKGPVEVIAAGTLPIGELGHMEDSDDKNLALGVKLKELVKSARIKAGCHRIGASGKSSSIRYLQVPPVPAWRLDMLVRYEVEEKSGDREPTTYDYRTLDVPDVSGQDTIMIGALKEATSRDLLTMGKTAGLGQAEIDLEAVALYNAYFHGHGYDLNKTVLVVDIGADDLTILLVRNGSLYLARTMMGGGRRFTQALAEELKIDALDAEEIKKTQAQISFDVAPTTGRTGRMVRPGLTGIVPRGGTAVQPRPAPGSPPAAENAPPTDTAVLPVAAAAGDAPAAPAAEDTAANDKPKGDITVIAENLAAQQQKEKEILEFRKAEMARGAQQGAVLQDQETILAVPGAETVAETPASTVPALAPVALINASPAAPDLTDDKRKRQMAGALLREAASLCAALENAVLFSKQQTKIRDLKVDRVYLTGGGSRLKGLVEFMARRMRLEVQPLEPFKQLSLSRFSSEQADALRAEQHNMAVAVGLAISKLQKGTFNFLLWPAALTERKIFWARGAYVYYAAALVAMSLGLFLYTPYRNTQDLADNDQKAKAAVETAQKETRELAGLTEANREKRQQLKQIFDNTRSGEYFLKLIAELKNNARISDDVYLSQISTSMPAVVKKAGGVDPGAGEQKPTKAEAKKAVQQQEPNSFLAMRRVYLRGFVRANDKMSLLDKVEAFEKRLVPHPEQPDHPDNLFKHILIRWHNPEDQTSGPFCLKEFVLEAYAEGIKEPGKAEAGKAEAAPAEGPKAADPAQQVSAPAAAGTTPAVEATAKKRGLVLPAEAPAPEKKPE